MPIRTVVETDSVHLSVPLERLRVSIDSPHRGDVVMYEDYGPGLARGMVLMVQTRVGELQNSLIAELKLFQGPDEELLDQAQVVEVAETPGSGALHYRLRVPPMERPMGAAGTIVEREAQYVMGDLYEDRGSICRLQVAWNPSTERGPGIEQQLAHEFELARDAFRLLKDGVRKCHSARAA